MICSIKIEESFTLPDLLNTTELNVAAAVHSLMGEGYGITIRERIQDRADIDMMLGTIYSILEKLEKRKLVVSRWGEATAERGGRRKRLYKLTGDGVMAMARSIDTPNKILGILSGQEVKA